MASKTTVFIQNYADHSYAEAFTADTKPEAWAKAFKHIEEHGEEITGKTNASLWITRSPKF